MSTLQENLDAIKLDKDTNLKPENLKKDVTCLGVTGTYEGSGGGTVEGIKQFATIEEMQNSTGNKEGDLAVVYRSEIKNATVDSKFQTATFPETVVLDTAITDYVDIRYRATDSSVMFDCMGMLDSSSFMMDCYSDSGEIRIEYRSSDGITYNRTDTTGNPVDFGTEIYYEMAEMWNDAIGKFIQVGGNTFEGLYSYQPYLSNHLVNAAKNISGDGTFEFQQTDIKPLFDFLTEAINNNTLLSPDGLTLYTYSYGYRFLAVVNSATSYSLYSAYDKNTTSLDTVYCELKTDTSNKYEWIIKNNSGWGDKGIRVDVDTSNKTITSTYITDGTETVNTSSAVVIPLTMKDSSVMVHYLVAGNYTIKCSFVTLYKYLAATTQLTLTKTNELLPGKIAYGKNGVVTGDESIYSNIDYTSVFKHHNGDLMNVSKNVYSGKRETGIPSYLKNIEYNKFGVTTSKFISKTSYEGLANANISGEFIYNTTNYTILNWNEDVLVYDKSGNLIHHQTLTGLGTEYINISIIDRGEKVYLINLYTKSRFDILPSGIESKTIPVSVSGTWNKVWDVGNDDLLLFPQAAKLSKYSLSGNTFQVIRQESSGGGKNTGGVTFDNDYVYCGQVNNRIYVLNRTDLTYVGMTDNYYNVFSNRNNCYAYNTSTKFIYTIHGMDLVKIAECKRINVKYILYYDIEHSRVIYPDWSYTIACDNNSENQYSLGNISDIDVHMKCQNYNENLGKIIGYGVEDNGDFYEYETTFDKIIDGENTNNSIPLVILDNTHNKSNPYTIYKAIMLGLDTI